MASGSTAYAPKYGSVSLGNLVHTSGQQVQSTNATKVHYSIVYYSIAFPPPSGDGTYLINTWRMPYDQNNTACPYQGYIWAIVHVQTTSSGCFVQWAGVSSASWSNYGVGMANSTTSGLYVGMNNTVPTGQTWWLATQVVGNTDDPYAWQGCMVKLNG
jgi:hypothetical protein